MLATFAGFLLLLWAFAAAICALYTPLAFGLLEFDPLALHVVTGAFSAADLVQHERDGLVFSQGEINHFFDVARVVAVTRTCLIVLLATVLALIFWRPSLRTATTTRALGIFGFAVAAAGLGYGLAGYNATSDFLHGFAFDPGSHIFSPDSLTGHLYGNDDMIKGAIFVVGLAAFALVLAWLTARLSFPWSLTKTPKGSVAQARQGQGR